VGGIEKTRGFLQERKDAWGEIEKKRKRERKKPPFLQEESRRTEKEALV